MISAVSQSRPISFYLESVSETTANDQNDQTNDHVHVKPMNDQDPSHTSRSPQPSAAPVGNDAHMRP